MTATTERKTVPPIVCAPWCRDGDGHGNDMFVEDQKCSSDSWTFVQSLEPKWIDIEGIWHAREVEVFVEQGPRNPQHVVVYEQGGEVELRLTASEARDLASALVQRAVLLERGGEGVVSAGVPLADMLEDGNECEGRSVR
ncbi:hypothetical protein BH11ACT1_BH11ACT1_19180 [soil metagenome]